MLKEWLKLLHVLLTVHIEIIEKIQLNAQLILSILRLSTFRQPLHISGISRPIIRRYNRLYTTVGTYYSF